MAPAADDDGQLLPENQTVAVPGSSPGQALTTTIPITETIMASTTLTLPAEQASAPALTMPPRTGAVLALDLGTTTGWALRTSDGRIVSGTQDFRPRRFEGGGMRYLRFTDWLLELAMLSRGIGRVVFEEVRRHAGTDAAHIYGGFLGALTSWCEEHEIPYQGVPVGAVKRHITGRGNADKAAVTAAVRARGFAPADDNEADAIAILLWAIETGGGVR